MRFPENARVCFVGDSITHGNHFVSRIAGYYAEHFREDNVNFYNCGISGATTDTTLRVFDINVAPYHPTHAVLMIGVNDSGRETLTGERSAERYAMYKVNFERYKENLDKICKRLEEIGAQVTLVTPVPVDEYSKFDTPTLPGALAMLTEYANYVKAYAKEKGYPLCDTFSAMTEALWNGECVYREDRIHPNELGHFYMAKAFLAHQGIDLGEYTPMPKFMEDWNFKASYYSNLITSEYFFLSGGYDLPQDDKYRIIKEKLESGTLNDFFTYYAKLYLKDKPRDKELRDEVNYIMEVLLKTEEYVNNK